MTGSKFGKNNSFYGKKHSEETKQKLREANLGNKYWLGKKHTEESKEKIRLSRLGKPNLSAKGKPKTQEHKEKQSNIMKQLYSEGKIESHWKGKTFSEEHRNNISKSRKELCAEGKIIPWNKGLEGEEYLKHYENGATWARGKKLHYPIWNKDLTGKEYSKHYKDGKVGPYVHGQANKPYGLEFNKQFKLAIKQRDGFLCLKCGMREEDSRQLFKSPLHVHHIDYNKQLTIKENCCALCTRCNSEVNFNRSSWTNFFQSLLKERYGYTYDELGNILITDLNQ